LIYLFFRGAANDRDIIPLLGRHICEKERTKLPDPGLNATLKFHASGERRQSNIVISTDGKLL